MNDFLSRVGSAHAVVIGGNYTGPVSDMAENLVKNVAGLYATIVVDSNLPQRLKDIANRVNEDAEMMRDKYVSRIQRRRQAGPAERERRSHQAGRQRPDVGSSSVLEFTRKS